MVRHVSVPLLDICSTSFFLFANNGLLLVLLLNVFLFEYLIGMYICSQSGELVHPIHLQSFVEEDNTIDDQSSQQTEQRQPLERGQPV
jgi:hypothetical protein